MAETHAAAFKGSGWPATDFERYLNDTTTAIFGDATCFVVMRVMGPEAEILTLATHPDFQGRGRAKAMLRAALDTLRDRGVEEVFLDVAEPNLAAIALYNRTGFIAFSHRAQYYANGASAICMKVSFP
ncbi:GNAT family N-acetyltransferase [Octadecabacter sp.]|nr:GNAT family N-acetyltransferase [Octadecabacter sp.]